MSQLARERLQRPRQAHIGAFVPVELRKQLVEHARAEDRSVSSFVRIAVGDYLARPPRERALREHLRDRNQEEKS